MITLTSKQIEKQLECIPLWYLNFNYAPVEYGKNVYKGLHAYKDLRDRNPHLIPTEKEFVNAFIQRTINCFPIEKLMINYEQYYMGLQARAKRAYRSLIREEHCITRMKEMYEPCGYKVLYEHEDDWKKGVDVTIEDLEGKRFYVHLFVDSPNARQFRKNKEKRGQGRDFTGHIDFPFKRKEGKKVGDFWLYSDEAIAKFLKKLK